jgi:hypothetical protein
MVTLTATISTITVLTVPLMAAQVAGKELSETGLATLVESKP